MIIDMQNYMTMHKYTGKWSSRGAGDYYYNRCKKTVMPNLVKLINFFKNNNMKIIYTRIASLDENFSDAPSTAKKILLMMIMSILKAKDGPCTLVMMQA